MNISTSPQLVYLDTSVFAGKVLLNDDADRKCALIIEKIAGNKLSQFTFVTAKFTLIELAELICRKKTQNEAKALLFDIMNAPDLRVMLLNPEAPHSKVRQKDYYDIDKLIANFVNTALKLNIPGFDTIHAHTIKKLDDKIIVVSKDKDFRRFKGLDNVKEVFSPSDFLTKFGVA